MLDRSEVACSKVDSAAGIVGYIVGGETEHTSAGNGFVKLPAVIIATLVVERVPPSKRPKFGGAVSSEVIFLNYCSAISRLNPSLKLKRRPRGKLRRLRCRHPARRLWDQRLFRRIKTVSLSGRPQCYRCVSRATATRVLWPRRSRTT